MSWRLRWRASEYLRNSLWLVPGVFVVVAILMGNLLPEMDAARGDPVGLSYGPAAGLAMLGAIVSGMIAFTGFVFSILLLAVQFGSSQFSPRLLRSFLGAPTTRVALGVFMATFVYSLMVMRTIGQANDPDFVPNDSISVGWLWLLLSMYLFLRLISRTTQSLRVASVVRTVGKRGTAVIRRTYRDPAPDAAIGETDNGYAFGAPTRVIQCGDEAGIIQSVDDRGLVRIARDADIVLELVAPIGDPVAPGMPLFHVYGPGNVDEEQLERSVAIGDERTMRQDPAFALRLLADISARALSPGVNDPTTSVQALDQIELLLRLLAGRRLSPGESRDESGQVRLRYPARSWDDLLSIALDETRLFGSTSVQVSRRLRALLDGLLEMVPSYRRPAVQAQLAMLDASIARAHSDPAVLSIAAAADRQGLGTPRHQGT